MRLAKLWKIDPDHNESIVVFTILLTAVLRNNQYGELRKPTKELILCLKQPTVGIVPNY